MEVEVCTTQRVYACVFCRPASRPEYRALSGLRFNVHYIRHLLGPAVPKEESVVCSFAIVLRARKARPLLQIIVHVDLVSLVHLWLILEQPEGSLLQVP